MSSHTESTAVGSPAAEFAIDEQLIRSLLRQQCPQYTGLSLQFVGAGFDNEMWRLGDDLALRLPRRRVAVDILRNEARWLPTLAASLPVAVPEQQFQGVPQDGYPAPWLVVPWLPGEPLAHCSDSVLDPEQIANFFRALHRSPPSDAPRNPYRGIPLTERARQTEPSLRRLQEHTDLITERLLQLWHDALVEPIDVEDTWIHGDLHALNVLVDRGRLTAVIDWGDIARGDRATDLGGLWSLVAEASVRAAVRDHFVEVSDTTWLRAQGWALALACVLVDTGRVDNPVHERMGREILGRLSDDL